MGVFHIWESVMRRCLSQSLHLPLLLLSVVLIGLGLCQSERPQADQQFNRVSQSISSSAQAGTTHINIEDIRVGQRVLTGLAADALRATKVDPATWKCVTLVAEWTWPDGTLDTFHVQSLQSAEWLAASGAQIGSQVPLPVDLQEMGCPPHLLANIKNVEPCPQIQDAPGCVVLTTVNHLNPNCRVLTVRSTACASEEIRTTDYHPFWSQTRQDWVQAHRLEIGEKLEGLHGVSLTLVGSQSIPGIHTVYNLTVETEHVYRVGLSACGVHNSGCSNSMPDYLYRTGSQTDQTLTDSTGVSFRNTISSSADAVQVFRPGDKIWAIDPKLLPKEAVRLDGVPHGHVSIDATPGEIRAAIIPHGPGNPLHELFPKPLEDPGAYRIQK